MTLTWHLKVIKVQRSWGKRRDGAESGEKWLKVGKSVEMWEKWWKVAKSWKKLGKLAKSGKKWLGVAICGFMWLKVVLCRPFWMSENSLSIAFLATSDRYATLIYFGHFWQNGCRRSFWMSVRMPKWILGPNPVWKVKVFFLMIIWLPIISF